MHWDCSVCTYRNTAEAFKCFVCAVRKGTSTRKPRLNPQLVAQQAVQQFASSPSKVRKERHIHKKTNDGKQMIKNVRHFRNHQDIERSFDITVNDVTVVITEYEPAHVAGGPLDGISESSSNSDQSIEVDTKTVV